MDFGFGPMSDEIIEAIFRYSHCYRIDMMLIASKNQIDYDKGYVATTKQYMETIKRLRTKYPQEQIWICRDHCGPGFKDKNLDSLEDTKATIDEDIRCGFDLIHIDLCHYTGDIINDTCELIEYAKAKNKDIEIEIGTDDITDQIDIKQLQSNLYTFADCKPYYYVVNTGSRIRENSQTGKFNSSATLHAHQILSYYGILLKEHNADYLSHEEIKKRIGIVDAMNIAPQLGAIQSSIVLAEALKYGIDPGSFITTVYNGQNWKKWELWDGHLKDSYYKIAIVAGHYHFQSSTYKELVDKINEAQYKSYDMTLKEKIILGIHNVINHYIFSSKADK